MQIYHLLRSFIFLLLAYLSLLPRKKTDSKTVIVGSDYGESLDSNATVLADALVLRGYGVIFVSNAAEVENVHNVKRGSFEAARLFLSAGTAFYSHSLSDILPVGHRLSFLKRLLGFPKLVFLQHGIIGLKSVLSGKMPLSSYIMSLEKTFDYMIVSSDEEKTIVHNMGVAKKKLAITGLPRFDDYHSQGFDPKKVLVFFTWQQRGRNRDKIDETLSSVQVGYMKRQGYQFFLKTHKMNARPNRSMSLPNEDDSLDFLVKECGLLITDDSSVAWDMFYLGKEVLFFKPETKWLVSKDSFKNRVFTSIDELDAGLLDYQRGRLEPIDLVFTKYKDKNNCHRVMNLLDK